MGAVDEERHGQREWLVEESTEITVGMPILDVETDKIANAVEALDAGLLRRRVVQAGVTLPVKALLGVLAPADVSDADIDAYVSSYVTPAEDEGDDEEAAAYHFVDVDGNGMRVRYAARGGDDASSPAVLFIHGFGGDLDNWLFNLDAVAEKHRVFAFDLPGHGQSTPKVPGTTLADLAAFTAKFMDAVNIGKAHLVGHSMGGGIAAQMAVDAPARVESVALISPVGLGDEINKAYIEGFVQGGVAARAEADRRIAVCQSGTVQPSDAGRSAQVQAARWRQRSADVARERAVRRRQAEREAGRQAGGIG